MRFDLLKPDVSDNVNVKQWAQVASRKGNRGVDFRIGDIVMVDDFSVRNSKRLQGTIVKRLSPVTFNVEIENEKVWKRHVIKSFESSRKTTIMLTLNRRL